MHKNNITISPFHFIDLLVVNIDKRPNEHPTAIVSGHISDDEDDSCVERSPAGQKISISAKDEDGEEKMMFNGIVHDLNIVTKNGLRVLTVKAIANTVYMDMQAKTRTFQDSAMSYL